MPLPQTEGKYEIASVEDWNTAVANSLTPCILTQGFDVAEGNLRQPSFEIDLNGKSILNIGGSVNQFGQQQNRFFDGGNCYNGEFNFAYNRAHDNNFSIFGSTLHENVRVSGSIVNTDVGRIVSVLGTVPQVNIGVKNNHYSVSLTSDTVRLVGNNTSSSYIDKCIFTGVYTATTFQIFGNQFGSVTNSFYRTTDNPTPVANNNGTTPAGMPKTTAELQTLATYTDIFVETETGVVTAEGTTTVTYVSGDNFSTLTVGDPFYLNGFKYEVATIVSNTELTLNTAVSTIVSVTGESLGTGDGTTTVFNTANTPVRSGTDTVYIDGTETTAYTIDLATGAITFDTAPALDAVLTVDYDYLSSATYRVGTGSIGLTSAYDMVLEGGHVAQTWFLPTSMYPRLYFEDKTFLLSGAITKDGVLQAGVVVQITAYDDYTMATGKQDVGNYETDLDGKITIPLDDLSGITGKKLLLTPHNEDTGTLSSDQSKFASNEF